MMKISRKIKSQQGLSVIEMLMAVLILTLILSFIGGGVTVIKDAYLKITLRTEAQTLLSSLITAVTNELQSAKDIDDSKTPNESFKFYNIERGYDIYFENKDDNIYIKTEIPEQEETLVPQKAITNGLVPKIEDFDYSRPMLTCTIKIYYKDQVYAEQRISVCPINED